MAARKTTRTAHRKTPRPTRTRRKAATPVPVPAGGRLWLLDVPYGERPEGATFDRARKAWVWAGPTLPPTLNPYRSRPYSRLRWLEDDVNGVPGPPPVGVASKTPRPIQVSGAKAIAAAAAAGAPGFLLTDDVGTGKTITMWLGAAAAARIRGAETVLVLVDRPAAITIPHWRDTIAAVGDAGLRILISSPDSLPKLLARNGRAAIRFDIVIADEAHLYRNVDTRRVKAFRALTRFGRPSTDAPFLIAATATPAQHPAELTYLAPLLAHLHGEAVDDWSNLGARLAKAGIPIEPGPYGKWVWNHRSESDPRMQEAAIGHVRSWLTTADPPLSLHRPAPWGPAPLDLMPVQLTPAELSAYRTAWAEFRTAMRQLSAGTAVTASGRARKDGRAAVLRFRQKASLLRVQATADWAAAQVEAGMQVAVSCEFVSAAAAPIADLVEAAGVPVARIFDTAGSGRDAEAERMRFQTGATPVVVFTPTASMSLHASEHFAGGGRATAAPRVGVMHNVRYSGLAGRQILGRTHRDHQVCPWWLAYAEDTTEADIAATMIGRFKAAADTAGADTKALEHVAELLGASWLPTDVLTGNE